MQPEMLGQAGGTVDVMTAHGGGGGVVEQPVAKATPVGMMHPGQQSVGSYTVGTMDGQPQGCISW